jgi:hypothetical protein
MKCILHFTATFDTCMQATSQRFLYRAKYSFHSLNPRINEIRSGEKQFQTVPQVQSLQTSRFSVQTIFWPSWAAVYMFPFTSHSTSAFQIHLTADSEHWNWNEKVSSNSLEATAALIVKDTKGSNDNIPQTASSWRCANTTYYMISWFV